MVSPNRILRPCLAGIVLSLATFASGCSASSAAVPDAPEPTATSDVPASPALEPYTETILGTAVTFDMVPIPGGVFTMGSPSDEAGRAADEGPQHQVRLEPFWIGKCEVTWDEYTLWAENLDGMISKDPALKTRVDGITRPTPAYADMTFDMGLDGCPAICMTQHAAKTYCEWLSAATGHTYRLPTEAEWEYACRAGTTTAYSFGDDPAALTDHAWFEANNDERYHEVGQKKPNPWGLHDMHGNVAEWVLDQYLPDFYARELPQPIVSPLAEPTKTYSRVVRGGSWQDPVERLRSAARRGSDPSWKEQDPQIPKSIWYHTDAPFVGFRVVRPGR